MHDTVSSIVDLIERNETNRAVDWANLRHTDKRCAPCFYSPLDPDIRCASCLETHLNHALLKRSYSQIAADRIETARKHLATWVKKMHAA